MAITLYDYADVGAPQLVGGIANELETVLDAVLINGYGAKPAAGWTKPFTGTDQWVYQNSQVNGTGTYYAFDSTFYTYSTRVRGYSSMTDVITGIGEFPTVAQNLYSYIPQRSTATAGNPRPWMVIADDTFVVFLVQGSRDAPWVADQTTYYTMASYLGDCESYVAGDVTHSVVCAQSSTPSFNATYNDWLYVSSTGAANTSCYIRESLDGIAGSHQPHIAVSSPFAGARTSGGDTNVSPYPSPITGGLSGSKILIADYDSVTGARSARGHLKGVIFSDQQEALTDLDTFTFEGNTYMAKNIKSNNRIGQVFLQISGAAV